MQLQPQQTHNFCPSNQRVGLVDSSRQLLFLLLQHEYRQDGTDAQETAIELERRYLSERLASKPGTAIFLERILSDLYEDARQQLQRITVKGNPLPPPGCPYTLASLLGTSADSAAA